MADAIIRIAAAHGFKANAYADGSVGIIIPTYGNGTPGPDFIASVRTVDEAYDALGY